MCKTILHDASCKTLQSVNFLSESRDQIFSLLLQIKKPINVSDFKCTAPRLYKYSQAQKSMEFNKSWKGDKGLLIKLVRNNDTSHIRSVSQQTFEHKILGFPVRPVFKYAYSLLWTGFRHHYNITRSTIQYRVSITDQICSEGGSNLSISSL